MIIYTGGTFDLFHVGHVRFLKRCAEMGRVTVSLNTDDFVARYKGRHPVIPYADRAEVLEACRFVDAVVPNIGGENSKPAIERVNPDVIAVGSDWAERDYHAQMGFTPAWLDARGILLVFLPYTEGVSSREIRAALP